MEFDGLRECAWVLRGRAIVCTGIAYKFRWEQCVSLWPRARAAAQLLLHTTKQREPWLRKTELGLSSLEQA